MKRYQVVGIGNAIVDVISQADDSFLDLMGIGKGIMQLVERERGEMLYASMKERVQAPGGAVAARSPIAAKKIAAEKKRLLASEQPGRFWSG